MSILPNAVAFALLVPAVLVGLEIAKPKMYLQRSLDPILPVIAGSFTAWAYLHNTVGILRPFYRFDVGELVLFLGFNVLEFALIGAVLSTLARTRLGGFALGFGLQIAYLLAFALGVAVLF